jgi:hypothetical protein
MNEPAPTHETVPAHTTPTWEMELLVSGATVFGLMQLPQLLDHAYFRVVNLSPADYAMPLFALWGYSKFATISLVITFVMHLCLRGYWVALVGMNSVYPGGIRWEKLRMGSVARDGIARDPPTMAAIIEAADNRATRIFAVGFGFAMLMLKLAFAVLLLLGLCLLFDAAFGGEYTAAVFGTILAVAVVPIAVAVIVDRRFGKFLSPGHTVHQTIGRVLSFYSRLGVGPRSNPLIALFTSHEGRSRSMAILLTFMIPIAMVIMMQNSVQKRRLPMGLFVGLSTDDPYSASASPNAFYSDADDDSSGRLPLPHIPGRVAEGVYLPLFVPFLPRLHGPALQRACPASLAMAREPAATRARLECLAKLSDIRIDGTVQAVELQASTDPRTGQPGMLAMLPVGALAPGRHELSLSEPARDSLAAAGRFRRYRIPFWK